jgi:U3 small nucleolar RNA-associated protein 15
LDALRSALAGRDDLLLEPILAMLLKQITDPRFSKSACSVATLLLGKSWSKTIATECLYIVTDMYADVIGQSPLIDNLLVRLKRKVTAELRFQDVVAKTLGALDMILCNSAHNEV